MVNILRAKQFGPTSEKAVDQYPLFDEAEVETWTEGPSEAVDVPGHTRAKGGRKPLPDNLPREEIVHDLAEDQKVGVDPFYWTSSGP